MHRWICEMSVTQTSTSLCRELCWKRNLYHLKNIYTFLIWTIQSFYFFPSSTGIRIICSKRNFITSSHCSHFVYDCVKSFAVAWQFSMNLSYELLHLKIANLDIYSETEHPLRILSLWLPSKWESGQCYP